MKKVDTPKAADILLNYAIESYKSHGIRKRVNFRDVAHSENVEEDSMRNGLNHLEYLKWIRADIGGGFYLNPKRLGTLTEMGLLDGIDPNQSDVEDEQSKKRTEKDRYEGDWNDSKTSLAADLYTDWEAGVYRSFAEATRWAEKNITHNGNPVSAKRLYKLFYKARNEGRI